ncbi:hypothetical protein RJU59_00480 [Buchnera aphidicola (Kurisakia onigurumii)]|uniref:hypothetical protein n=1 Tax=Buchnera aphidicola TaxID=9 RepID=UPI0031B6E0A5
MCNKYQKKIFIFLKKYYFKNFFFSIDILKKNKIFYLNKNYILEINNIFVKKKLFKPWLLTEICDFKKLETYLFLSFSIIKKGLQGLILVESMHSSFVLQLKKNLKIRFKIHVEEYHSNISIKKYNNIWKIIRKKIPVIIISTKEGIFLPMENLGIIIVNNESSIEYKIKNRWFCNARNIAIVRAKKENIPILLESYRWNISSKKNVLDKKYYFINLYNLYKKNVKRQKKIIFIYSNREQYKGIFSLKLIQKTEYYLKKNKNVLFIVNKSFFSIFNILKCKKCKYIEKCTVCNQYYRFYDHYQELFCHFCFVRKNIYFLCTKCNTHSLFSERIGISFIKKNLNKFFYKKNIIYIYNKKNLLEVKKKLNSKSILRLQTPSIIFLCDDFVCNFWIQDISFIAFLSLDYLKYSNKFRQLEYFVQKYEVLHSKINYHSYISEILIQIFEKNIFLINFFSKGYNYFLEQTFRFRKINSLPPFSYHIVMFFNDKKIKKIKFLIFFLKNFINQNNNFFIMDLIILESDNIQFNKYKKYYYFKILLSYNNLKKIHYFVNKIILLIKNNKIFRSILIKVDSDPIDN